MEGINIRGTYSSIYDFERVITNVTIKDAPYELSDNHIIYHMKMFGKVIEHSVRRGKIIGTDIETGTRYLQMVNVEETIPIKVNLDTLMCAFSQIIRLSVKYVQTWVTPFIAALKKMNPARKFAVDENARDTFLKNVQMI